MHNPTVRMITTLYLKNRTQEEETADMTTLLPTMLPFELICLVVYQPSKFQVTLGGQH